MVNGGVTGYNTWNILVDLAFRVAVLQPDLVIVYDGWNDLDAREQSPDCYSGLSPFLGLDAMHLVRADLPELSVSALYRFARVHLGWMPNPALEDRDFIPSRINCSAQVGDEIPQNVINNPPVYFERNQRDMIALAKANGYKIMFMTWAYDKTSAQLPEYRPLALEEDNDVTRRVAQENNVPLFDYATVAQSGPDFWSDVAHHNPQGNMVQAQAIAKFLADQSLITDSATASTS